MDGQFPGELVSAALEARGHAYAPYSDFHVGAAVWDGADGIWTGANVENASFGLTLCAERVALAAAVSAGQRQFAVLAVATLGGHAPCGGCRQFAREFSADMRVVLIDSQNSQVVRDVPLADLLPMSFEFPETGESS